MGARNPTIWTRQGLVGNSVWGWGLPLVTIDADSGRINASEVDLPSWASPSFHPHEPGRLVMPEGSARETFATYSLVDFNVINGKTRVLISESEGLSIHDPLWSPDGQLIAYSAVTGIPNDATWNGDILDSIDHGRAIYIMDTENSHGHQLTQPGKASDSHPLWLPAGRSTAIRAAA